MDFRSPSSSLAPCLSLLLLVACGDDGRSSPARDTGLSSPAGDAGPSDAGPREVGPQEVGPAEDMGPGDAGPGDSGSGGGPGDGGRSDAGRAFVPGEPSSGWTLDVRARMLFGLEEGSCGLYRSPQGQTLRTEVLFRRASMVPLPTEATWTWRIIDEDGRLARAETFAVVGAARLELEGRETRLGADRLRQDTYGFSRTDRPIVVELDASGAPTAMEWTIAVEGITSVSTSMGGSGSNLPEETHRFTWTAEDISTPGGGMRAGYAVAHAIDDRGVTSYEVVPAFGILAFEHAGLRYALCDFRQCAPEGCAGAPSCEALACP